MFKVSFNLILQRQMKRLSFITILTVSSVYPTDSIRYGSRRTEREQFAHRIRHED